MTKFLQLLLSGAATGSLYGLMAIGLVLIYRTTATLNFAHGMMATVGAWGYAILVVDHGWNAAAAFVALFPLGALTGLITYRLVAYPLGDAGTLERTMATILWMVVIQASMALIFGSTERIVPAAFSREVVKFGDVVLAKQQIGAVIVTLVLCFVLFVFFRFSQMGLASRAVALGRRSSRIAGLPLVRIDAMSWVLGGMLAAVGGAIIAPFTLTDLTTMNILLTRVLGAALVGLLVSLPLALAGGVIIGVSEQMLQGFYSSTPQVRELVPFIIVMVVLASRSCGDRRVLSELLE